MRATWFILSERDFNLNHGLNKLSLNGSKNIFCRNRKDTNTNTTAPLNDLSPQDPHREYSITQNSQFSNRLPSEIAPSAELPDVGVYEAVEGYERINDLEIARFYQNDRNLIEKGNVPVMLNQEYVNAPVAKCEDRKETEEYEDIPDGKAYEPLKKVNYENTKNMNDIKVYTKLENN